MAPESCSQNGQTHVYIYVIQNMKKLLEVTGHYFNQKMDFSRWATKHVTVANIYCQKLPRSYVYSAHWLEVCVFLCVSACHEELVWPSAMQLEAIIEPITFCLLLSFAFPLSSLLSLSVSFSSSLSSAPNFSVCLILIQQACLLANRQFASQLTPSFCPHSHLPCTDWYNSSPPYIPPPPFPNHLQTFLSCKLLHPPHHPLKYVFFFLGLDFSSSCLAARVIDSDVKCL